MSSKIHILIIGAGSAGKRHAQNLSSLGCEISAFDPREDRLKEITEKIGCIKTDTDLERLRSEHTFDGAVIASPPIFHIAQAQELAKKGTPVLMEKPLSAHLVDAELLKDINTRILLGYTYRWWKPLIDVKAQLDEHDIGTVRHVRMVMSAHLADWHPWENYKDFFMAKKEMGGGALLDESHFIDLMIWMFGMPKYIFANVETIGNLEINSDDSVDLIARYANGTRVNMHLDLLGRPHEKYIHIVGDGGSIRWSFEPNEVVVHKAGIAEMQTYTSERNDMFKEVAAEFIEMIEHNKHPSCTIADGMRVLEVVEAARKSSQEHKEIILT